MKVKAKRLGQHNGVVREVNDEFEIEGKPASWMEPVLVAPLLKEEKTIESKPEKVKKKLV